MHSKEVEEKVIIQSETRLKVPSSLNNNCLAIFLVSGEIVERCGPSL